MIIKMENNSLINIGIQIFRMLLCFWVVLDHCLDKKMKYKFNFFFKIRLHVPCFIFISFFFSYKVFSERNYSKIRKRFERLLIPYFIFPIIMLVLNNFSYRFLKFTFFGRYITFRDLLIQLIVGRKYIVVFWFQFFLIFATLLFIIISFLMKDKYLLMLELIYFSSYILVYSKFNYNLFLQYGPSIRYSLGHLAEVIPVSISGLVIASLSLVKIIKNYYKNALFISSVSLFFIFKLNIFSAFQGFAFSGFIFNLGSFFSFIIFYLFPFNFIKSKLFSSILYQITKYTQGIYSLHFIFHGTLHSKINILKDGSFNRCLMIYIFSYVISFIGEKLTKKSKLVYLFI